MLRLSPPLEGRVDLRLAGFIWPLSLGYCAKPGAFLVRLVGQTKPSLHLATAMHAAAEKLQYLFSLGAMSDGPVEGQVCRWGSSYIVSMRNKIVPQIHWYQTQEIS